MKITRRVFALLCGAALAAVAAPALDDSLTADEIRACIQRAHRYYDANIRAKPDRRVLYLLHHGRGPLVRA